MFKKRSTVCLSLALLTLTSTLFAASASSAVKKDLVLNKINTQYRFTYEQVSMPNNEKDMGLLGINYLFNLTKWGYLGFGGYAVVSGKRGGLFVLGAEAGLKHRLYKRLFANAGVFLGGGGGHSSLVGGGMMVRPHVGLSLHFKHVDVGVQYSKVHFTRGSINSNQVGLSVSLPSSLLYAPADASDYRIDSLKNIRYNFPGFWDFDRNFVSAIEQTYFQKNGAKNTLGKVSDAPMSLVGVRFGHFITPRTYLFLKLAGAFSGDNNGYMDVLGGLGYRYPFARRFTISAQLAAGAGGGGNTRVGGGIEVAPSINLGYQFTPHWGVGLAGGYIKAIDDDFSAATLNVEITYAMLLASASDHALSPTKGSYAFHTWHVHLLNQTYLRPQRISSRSHQDVQLIGAKFDTMITRHIYLVGQGTSAYLGNSGGYASGLFGAGIQGTASLWGHVSPLAEILVGAGGGGGLPVSGGLLVQPQVGLNYYFSRYLGVQATVGQVIAPQGDLDTTVLGASLTWHFSTLQNR
jgi:hypothetical protein